MATVPPSAPILTASRTVKVSVTTTLRTPDAKFPSPVTSIVVPPNTVSVTSAVMPSAAGVIVPLAAGVIAQTIGVFGSTLPGAPANVHDTESFAGLFNVIGKAMCVFLKS